MICIETSSATQNWLKIFGRQGLKGVIDLPLLEEELALPVAE